MKVDLVGVDLVRVDLMGVDLMCTHRVFLYSGVVSGDGRHRSAHSPASCQHDHTHINRLLWLICT